VERNFFRKTINRILIALAIILIPIFIWSADKYYSGKARFGDQTQRASQTPDNIQAQDNSPATNPDGTATRPHTAEDVYDKPAQNSSPATNPDDTPTRPHTAADVYDKPARTN
jgi:hypothetical protein